jgi:hydroxymethylpyrimidine/phosphomethylpyrimidine kinase
MLCGTAKGKHLVESVREAMQLLLRSLSQHEALNDVDQPFNLDMCS